MKSSQLFLTLCCALALSSCSLAPKFLLPYSPAAEKFKEDIAKPADDGSWQKGQPAEQADRGSWWMVFNDEKLNALEEEALNANQTLKAAAARVAKARAAAGMTAADLYPGVSVGAGPVRSATSAATAGTATPQMSTLYRAEGIISYEVDLFRRLGNETDAAEMDAEQEAATYRSFLLALQADVADQYFMLRALKAGHAILTEAVTTREENRRIMQKRFDEGAVGEQDLARAKADLALVTADLLDVERLQKETQHALALLLGRSPSSEDIAVDAIAGTPPVIPPGVPSTVLERRPDITAAQNALAAANARIGVARASFFPRLSLTASGGFESPELPGLFSWSNRTWLLGPLVGTALTLPVFEGGRSRAKTAMAKAGYEEAVANYRQQVLAAFKDVEDHLSGLTAYAGQAAAHKEAVQAARKSMELAQKRYDEGYVDYFEVVDAERTALTAERAALQTRLNQYQATVGLIRAIGGSWD